MSREYEDHMINEVEDYGVKNKLQNINLGIDKILKSNINLIQENTDLNERIKDLELNIDTLIKNNENLAESLYISNKKESQTDNTENVSCLLPSIKKTLSLDNKSIEDDFLKYILNLVTSIIKDEENQIKDEYMENLVLDIINTLYKTIDEDLLIDFTKCNHLSILEIIEDKPRKLTSMIVKIARILYSLEDVLAADNYILLLNFDDLEIFIEDTNIEEIIIELILIHIYLLDCNSMIEIEFLWSKLKNKSNIECKNIKYYLEVKEKIVKGGKVKIDKCIEMLNLRLKDISEIDKEVKCTIRLNTYVFMLEQLEKTVDKYKEELKIENKSEDEKYIEINKNLESEYFSHKLYRVANDKYMCPLDTNELREKTIVEKVYRNTLDIRQERKPIFKEIEVLYCSRCEEHFISKENEDMIKGFIKVTQTSKTILPSVDPLENEYNLNDISLLKIRGYHTGLEEDERWEILKNRCIPELGRDRVLSYLIGFVKMFSKQKKDYSNAIRIWEKDINKINNIHRKH